MVVGEYTPPHPLKEFQFDITESEPPSAYVHLTTTTILTSLSSELKVVSIFV